MIYRNSITTGTTDVIDPFDVTCDNTALPRPQFITVAYVSDIDPKDCALDIGWLSDREMQVGLRGRGYKPRHHDVGVRIRPEPHARSNP